MDLDVSIVPLKEADPTQGYLPVLVNAVLAAPGRAIGIPALLHAAECRFVVIENHRAELVSPQPGTGGFPRPTGAGKQVSPSLILHRGGVEHQAVKTQ